MKLEGIHHVTAITGDAPRNLDFYVRVLGLRLVKKTVSPDVRAEHALLGFDAVRVLALDPVADARLLGGHLAFEELGDGRWEARGQERGGTISYAPASERGRGGAGTVHHVAWHSHDDE